MRIAVWHNLPSGGGKRALHDQVNGLLARGHTLEAWRPDSAATDFLPLDRLIPEHVLPLPAGTRFLGDAPAGRWPGARLLGDIHTIRQLIKVMHTHARECAEQIQARGFDVVLAHPCRFFHAPQIGRYLETPKALYLQEPLRHIYEAMPTLSWLALPTGGEADHWRSRLTAIAKGQVRVARLRALATEEQANARAFDHVLANSYYSAESIQRAYGLSPRVAYLGLDEGLFRDLGLPREPFVVGLGSLNWIKGVDLAVAVIARLPEPRPALVWVCNSVDTDYRATVEAQARQAGVTLDIRAGLPDEEVVRLLNQASVMLYTSRLEPFGYAPLEANLCGAPVVAVAEGGVRETVHEGVNGYTAPRDPVALAAALRRLLDDPPLARRLGQQGRDHVREQWNMERSIRNLENHLLRVVHGDGAV